MPSFFNQNTAPIPSNTNNFCSEIKDFDDRLKKLFDEETEKLKPKQPMSENKIDWEFLTALGDKGLTTRIRRVMEMCGLSRDNNDALMFYNNYPLQWRTFGEKANKTLENYLLKKGLIKKEK